MTSKYQIILCDSCVVIELFRLNLWEQIISSFEITVSSTIVNEVTFYRDNQQNKHPINLRKYIISKKINKISVPLSMMQIFYQKFDPSFQDRLDPGELELLAHLFNNKNDNLKICSADSIVFKILGKECMSEHSISLEEILPKNFPKKQIHTQFTKKFKEKYLQDGLQFF